MTWNILYGTLMFVCVNNELNPHLSCDVNSIEYRNNNDTCIIRGGGWTPCVCSSQITGKCCANGYIDVCDNCPGDGISTPSFLESVTTTCIHLRRYITLIAMVIIWIICVAIFIIPPLFILCPIFLIIEIFSGNPAELYSWYLTLRIIYPLYWVYIISRCLDIGHRKYMCV